MAVSATVTRLAGSSNVSVTNESISNNCFFFAIDSNNNCPSAIAPSKLSMSGCLHDNSLTPYNVCESGSSAG